MMYNIFFYKTFTFEMTLSKHTIIGWMLLGNLLAFFRAISKTQFKVQPLYNRDHYNIILILSENTLCIGWFNVSNV